MHAFYVYLLSAPRRNSYPMCLDYVSDHCSMAQVNKLVLPLAYKMLDDSRTEMKQKTEKLVKKLYFMVGHQVID